MRTAMSWSGIIPALATPLTSEGELDERALRRVIEFTVGQGVRALSVLGLPTGRRASSSSACSRRSRRFRSAASPATR